MPTSRKEFEAVFPSLVEDISGYANSYGIPPQALAWFQKVIIPHSRPLA